VEWRGDGEGFQHMAIIFTAQRDSSTAALATSAPCAAASEDGRPILCNIDFNKFFWRKDTKPDNLLYWEEFHIIAHEVAHCIGFGAYAFYSNPDNVKEAVINQAT
jgi:hypothetical protein